MRSDLVKLNKSRDWSKQLDKSRVHFEDDFCDFVRPSSS